MFSFVIACVGKPSAGKSSFLNAVTDATAKVGNYPFTTIEPNQGVAYYPLDCPCRTYNTENCKPRYGYCQGGTRYVPVKIMDVAGLVPGANEGRGLGNKFLDDLRHADGLIHVVDASGTTDAEGKETKGYDPLYDIQWLRTEIECWIYGNLEKRWPGIVRRHQATKSKAVDTLQTQLAGYGTNKRTVQTALDQRKFETEMENWTLAELREFVRVFVDQRFPTVVALNKIDHRDADRNIASITRKHQNAVLVSALSECLLKKLAKQGQVVYRTGDDDFVINESVDMKTRQRLENLRDLVLFRYGSTGTQETIVKAVEALGYMPVYPVKSLRLFPDCMLVREGTTVGELANKLFDADKEYVGAETVGGIQLAEDEALVVGKNNIVKFLQ